MEENIFFPLRVCRFDPCHHPSDPTQAMMDQQSPLAMLSTMTTTAPAATAVCSTKILYVQPIPPPFCNSMSRFLSIFQLPVEIIQNTV